MHFYSPILLVSLLATGLASSYPTITQSNEQLQLPNSVQQHLIASNDTCTGTQGKSPSPGCGRRE
jgi:hypothetical protein